MLTEYSAARSYFGLLLVSYWMIGPQVIEVLENSTKFSHVWCAMLRVIFVDGREIKNCVRSCERFILSTSYRKKTGRIVSSYRLKSWYTTVNDEAKFSVDWLEIAVLNGTGLLALESLLVPLVDLGSPSSLM